MSILELINAVRSTNGLAPLRPNSQLADAATRHARDIARNPIMTEDPARYHVGSDGSTILGRITASGYRPVNWREVTGWGWGGDEERQMDYWIRSMTHRAIILSDQVDEAGVGYVYDPGSKWGHYWVVDFGRRAGDVEPPPSLPYSSHIPIVVGGGGVGAPTVGGIDLLDYLRGDGRAYMIQHPSGGQEKFRTVMRPANRWLQLKNSQWEEFWYTDDYIWRGVDTSPGEGQYYRQFEAASLGARWCPRRMAIGQDWIAPVQHTVQTYDKATCRPVDHHRNGQATNRLRLAARQGAMTWNGVTVEDVVELVTHTGEHMFFGRGYGLVAWASSWGSSAISVNLPAQEADNQPEAGCFGE